MASPSQNLVQRHGHDVISLESHGEQRKTGFRVSNEPGRENEREKMKEGRKPRCIRLAIDVASPLNLDNPLLSHPPHKQNIKIQSPAPPTPLKENTPPTDASPSRAANLPPGPPPTPGRRRPPPQSALSAASSPPLSSASSSSAPSSPAAPSPTRSPSCPTRHTC